MLMKNYIFSVVTKAILTSLHKAIGIKHKNDPNKNDYMSKITIYK